MVNLPLHGFVVLFLRDVTSNLNVTSANICGVYATFLVSPTFNVKEVILLLGTYGFLLMGTYPTMDDH